MVHLHFVVFNSDEHQEIHIYETETEQLEKVAEMKGFEGKLEGVLSWHTIPLPYEVKNSDIRYYVKKWLEENGWGDSCDNNVVLSLNN